MKIYAPSNTSTPLIDVAVDDDSNRQHELMGHDMLTLRFSLAESVDFPLRCYCSWDGRKYIMFSLPEVTKKHERCFDYILTMYTAEYWLSITAMRDLKIVYGNSWTTTGGDKTKFPLTATPREHLQYIVDCLNSAAGSEVWKVDYSRTLGMVRDNAGSLYNYDGVRYRDDGDMMLVSYENQYCIDALKAVADTFVTEHEVEDVDVAGQREVTYHLLCLHRVEYHKNAPLEMKYGKGQGFESGIARRNDTETPPLDRLYVQGGEHNIPEHYGQTESGGTYTGEKMNNLLLPKPYKTSTYIDGIRNIRYDGETLYYETGGEEDFVSLGTRHFVYFWLNTECVYKYGNIDTESGVQRGDHYMYADATPSVPHEIPSSEMGTGGVPKKVIDANTWKRYEVSDDRRSLYRATSTTYYNNPTTPTGRTPLRSTNVEGFYDGSEVYPMRVGHVSYVLEVDNNGIPYTDISTYPDGKPDGAESYYDIFDDDTDLTNGSLNYKYLGIGGETMTVIFQDGMLAGREFNIQTINDGGDKPNCSIKTISGDTLYCIPLCQSEQDGIVMPTKPFIPAIGDHYIVFHCQLPETYVVNAECRMMWQAVDYMYYRDDFTYSFSGDMDSMFAKANWTRVLYPVSNYMEIGRYIKVTDTSLFGINGQSMRVTSISQKINDLYDIELSLSNAPQAVFNWAKRLASTVKEVKLRPPHWRPWNHILPPPIHGYNGSRQVQNLTQIGTDVLSSRRNSFLPAVDELIEYTNANTSLRAELKTMIDEFNSSIEDFNVAVSGQHTAEGNEFPEIKEINWKDCYKKDPSQSYCQDFPDINPMK